MVQQPTGLHETHDEIRGTLDQPQDTMLVLVVTLQEIHTVMVVVAMTQTVATRMEGEMNSQLLIKEEEEAIETMVDPSPEEVGVDPTGPPGPPEDLMVLGEEEGAETPTEMMVAHHPLMLELLDPTLMTSSMLNEGCLRSTSGCKENHNKKTVPKQER